MAEGHSTKGFVDWCLGEFLLSLARRAGTGRTILHGPSRA